MGPPPDQSQKKFAPVRPLLNQPPLTIENLPSRIQNGECIVLPPKFSPPMMYPPPTPGCQPCGQPPSCFYPNPCCSPYPPPCTPMCCPCPCPPPPIYVCPPPCTPCTPSCQPCPPPCMPCPPCPPCCPSTPCPCAPPPCQPKCCGGGGGGCCGSGGKQIICIPRRAPPMSGTVGGSCGGVQLSTCGGGSVSKKAPSPPSKPGGLAEGPASYNNCNFYLSDIPKGLRDKFPGFKGGRQSRDDGDDEDDLKYRRGTAKSGRGGGGDDECVELDDMINPAAGDDQIVHPPVGYPGSQRSPWGAGDFPGLGDGDPYGMHGIGGGPGTTAGPGGKGRGERGGRNSGDSRSTAGTGAGGGRSNYASAVGGGRGGGGRGGGVGGRGDPSGGKSQNNSRYPTGRGGADDHEDDDEDNPRSLRGNHGADPSRSNYSTAKNAHGRHPPTHDPSTAENPYRASGAASAAFSHASGFRPYSYSNAELTEKSQAYLPEKYDIPPPHEYNKSIHPSRAPMTPYATYNRSDDDDEDTLYSSKKNYFGGGRGPPSTRSKATMKPSCSTVRLAYAQTSRHRQDDKSTTAVPSTNWHSTGVETGRSMMTTTTKRTGPSTKAIHTTGVGGSRGRLTTNKSAGTTTNSNRARSAPPQNAKSFGRFPPSDYGGTKAGTVPAHKSSTRTNMQRNAPSKTAQRSAHGAGSYRTMQPDAENNSLNDTDPPGARSNHSKFNMKNNGKNKKRHNGDDPCRPKAKTCLKYHERRLHRLCSFSNKREKRLSELHKPVFHIRKPACPIRETWASILRKQPPQENCDETRKVPAYHDYCMTDQCPAVNRYPLLTRELMDNCGEEMQQDNNQNLSRNANESRHAVETRGAKRRQHHR